MPTATQLNLPLDNEIGTLARLCRDLAHGGVNLLAIAAPETGREKGGVRLLVLNREVAVRALSKAGYLFTEEQVLFLEMTNRPGALAKAIEKLARAASIFATSTRRQLRNQENRCGCRGRRQRSPSGREAPGLETETNAHSSLAWLLKKLGTKEARIACRVLLVDCRADVGTSRIVVSLVDDDLNPRVGFKTEPRHSLCLVENVEDVEAKRQLLAFAATQPNPSTGCSGRL